MSQIAVLDRTGTEARRESARDAPPICHGVVQRRRTVRFYHNKWDNNYKKGCLS